MFRGRIFLLEAREVGSRHPFYQEPGADRIRASAFYFHYKLCKTIHRIF